MGCRKTVSFFSKTLLLFSLALFILCSCDKAGQKRAKFGIVIHGGAGTIKKESFTPELEKEYRDKLQQAIEAGYKILEHNGSSLDAVEATLAILEDSPLFNAGKGAVFASSGKNELDASIMDGKTLEAGAVSGVKHIKNPVKAARTIMDNSRHILMYGSGAEEFCRNYGIEFVDEDYFYTERRWQSLQRAQNKQDTGEKKHGTVGAVALDKHGNLAAATSTGGLTNKMYGRIGDSPIIGAGNYANNETCAISGTGTGEYFMRTMAGFNVSALMEYGNQSLDEAVHTVVHDKIGALGGDGGLIGIDKDGNTAMVFNTAGMYRGFYTSESGPTIMIFNN